LIVGVKELGPLGDKALSVGFRDGDEDGGGVADSDWEGATVGVVGASGDLFEEQADNVAMTAIAAPPATRANWRVKLAELMAGPFPSVLSLQHSQGAVK